MALNLNFVKFQRGTQAQYNRLKQMGSLESDALYFIYDKTRPNDGGLLYLGDVLIGGTSSASGGAISLNELTDIDFSGVTLLDGMILQYNDTTEKWEPVSRNEFLPSVNSGTKTGNKTDNDILNEIDPTPVEGDIVFVDNIPYIYNGNSWQLLVGQDLQNRVATLESQMQAVDGKIATAVSNAQHLKYEVVGTLPSTLNAKANTIYLVGDGTTQGNNKYEEYMLVNNNFEKLGNFGPNLDNYVTTTSFNNKVGELESSISGLQSNFNNYVLISTYSNEIGDISDLRTATGDNTSTVVDVLVDIHDRLIWNELT